MHDLHGFLSARGRRSAREGRRPGFRIVTGLVLALVLSGLTSTPATAATLNEQRAALSKLTYAAAGDYVASRAYVPVLARVNGLAVKGAIASGMRSLGAARIALAKAGTQKAMNEAAVKVRAERQRAATTRRAGQQLAVLKYFRAKQQKIAQTALSGALSRKISWISYRATKARAAAFSTLLEADTRRQVGSLGKLVKPLALLAAPYTDELQKGVGSIPTAPGLVGFAGGCALPAASNTFRPVLPADGPGVATNKQLAYEAAARASSDEKLARVHGLMLRSASAEAKKSLSLSQLHMSYPSRVARLGYGWLSGSDTASRDALASDARTILKAGPEGMITLRSSGVLLTAATASDWVKLSGLDEIVLVNWLGPQTCLYADRENVVKTPTNVPVVHNAANFVAAAVFLKGMPAQSAALAQASLTSIQPGLRTITVDGGTQEGPGYWTFQSRAVATLYATLPNAYVTPPIVMPSLDRVSRYAINSTDPTGRPTAFGDATPEPLSPLMPAWDAKMRNDGAVGAWSAARFDEQPNAYLAWWRVSPGNLPARQSEVFPYTGLAALQLPDGTATLKGGSNAFTHSNRDLGTISLFRRGVQWAVDPGGMPEGTPGYYSVFQRYTYWKPGTAAHSTLSFTGMNQWATAKAAVTAVSSSEAWVDMRAALPGTSTARRTVQHTAAGMVVKDAVRSATPRNMTWQWVTDASVKMVSSTRATLTRDGQSITIQLEGVPSGSTLTAVAAPETGSDGKALTLLKLSMPRVTSLNLTATAF